MNKCANITNQAAFRHQQVTIEGSSIHVIIAGQADKSAVLFLHGFPENWQAFEKIMIGLSDEFYTVAIDLPGIGGPDKVASNDKHTIAKYVNGVINSLGLSHVTLVGQDAGGMVAYAYLHAYPNERSKAVIMNVAIQESTPGTARAPAPFPFDNTNVSGR